MIKNFSKKNISNKFENKIDNETKKKVRIQMIFSMLDFDEKSEQSRMTKIFLRI